MHVGIGPIWRPAFSTSVDPIRSIHAPSLALDANGLARRGWPILLVFALVWIGIAVLENPSFHSTTLRVDTDMDSFSWLNERNERAKLS